MAEQHLPQQLQHALQNAKDRKLLLPRECPNRNETEEARNSRRRKEMVTSLHAARNILLACGVPFESPLANDILELIRGLEDVDVGSTVSLLSISKNSHQKRKTNAHISMRAACVIAVERLTASISKMPKRKAYGLVAKSAGVSADSIKDWFEAAQNGSDEETRPILSLEKNWREAAKKWCDIKKPPQFVTETEVLEQLKRDLT